MMMTPRFDSKPSISTRSWLRVCSRSSCPPTAAPVRGLEKIDDFTQLRHGFIDPGHVLEGDAEVVQSIKLVPAPTEGERRVATHHPADQQHQRHAEGYECQHRDQQ